MLVIGLMGTIGAGKDVVSRYLAEKYGFKVYRMGDVARELAEKEGLEGTRENLQKIADEYFRKKGKTFFIDHVVGKIRNGKNDKYVINGVRALHDAEIPMKAFGKNFLIVLVDADPEIRFKRLKKRRRKGFPKTLDEFKKHERMEFKVFGMNKTMKLKHKTLFNNNSLEDLYKQVDELVKELL